MEEHCREEMSSHRNYLPMVTQPNLEEHMEVGGEGLTMSAAFLLNQPVVEPGWRKF